MPSQSTTEFGIEEARRVLGEVFAPWVQDLGLSIERIRYAAYCFACFLVAIFGLSWLMYLGHG